MTGLELFRSMLPELIAAAAARDAGVAALAVRALSRIGHWDLPIGTREGDALVGVILKKLETPNRWMADWRLRSAARKAWATQLWQVILKAEGIASRNHLKHLGREPSETRKMAVQTIRLVPSVREFIRDDENLYPCGKQFHDALKDVGLIFEDRREWLDFSLVRQDVSPIQQPLTVFILRPAIPGLFEEPPYVQQSPRSHAHRESQSPHRGTEEGRTVGRASRRAGPRAVDVGAGERTRK